MATKETWGVIHRGAEKMSNLQSLGSSVFWGPPVFARPSIGIAFYSWAVSNADEMSRNGASKVKVVSLRSDVNSMMSCVARVG